MTTGKNKPDDLKEFIYNKYKMNISKLFASIIIVVSFAFIPPVASAQQLSKTDQQFVDSIMNANYKPDGAGAVILIAEKGQPVFKKAYGLANMELNVSNKPGNVFMICSMSKQFTAVCILKLAQEGKLNLQDDITKYLPGYNTQSRHITIENLLSHTSGIVDLTGKKEFNAKLILDQSKEEIINFFMNDSLDFEPGTDWSYSSSGYYLAGLIVEKVSGLSLSEYLHQNIFTPLGMSHTSIGNYDSVLFNAVNGYDLTGAGKFKPAKYFSWNWLYAAGGIISNVDDLLKWDNALYTEKILKKKWLEKAWEPFLLADGRTTNYGFGWTSNNFQGVQFIEHSGGFTGFVSDGIRIPSQQLYTLILSNTTSAWPVSITLAITLRLIKLNLPEPSSEHLDNKTLEDFIGVYAIHHTSGEQIYQYLTSKDDTLFSQYQGGLKVALLNISKDLFVLKDDNLYYQFHRNENGNIISVELSSEPLQFGPHEIDIKTNISLPEERKAIVLDKEKLERLKGKYDFGGGIISPVTVEENKIYIRTVYLEKEEFFAEDETHFFSKTTDNTVEFIQQNGKVTEMILNSQGTKYEGKKIE